MNGELALEHIEQKLDSHIQQENADYKKLIWGVVSIICGLVATMTTWFVTYGALQEKVNTLEERQTEYVSRDEFDGLTILLNEKFLNLNDKLDDIKTALNIK